MHPNAPAEGTPERALWDVAARVHDPEIPVLTIADLGILRSVSFTEKGAHVVITPTYSGCPAMDTIRDDLFLALNLEGFDNAEVELRLAPAWTTDWLTSTGAEKLRRYGIAAPTGKSAVRQGPIALSLSVKCPRCNSFNTRELSRFGSTSCKALYECRACLEPFDYFKVL